MSAAPSPRPAVKLLASRRRAAVRTTHTAREGVAAATARAIEELFTLADLIDRRP